jgi:hypothetical protein
LAKAEPSELLEVTEILIARAGTNRADATAIDIAMLVCRVSATMASPTSDFDWHRHLELPIDSLRTRAVPIRPHTSRYERGSHIHSITIRFRLRKDRGAKECSFA